MTKINCIVLYDEEGSNLDETDREENFVIPEEYNPVQGGIKQTNFSHSVRNQESQCILG
jgi:hypothetical protein